MMGIACFKIQNNSRKNMSISADGSSIQVQTPKKKVVIQPHMLEYRQYMIYSALIQEMLIKL